MVVEDDELLLVAAPVGAAVASVLKSGDDVTAAAALGVLLGVALGVLEGVLVSECGRLEGVSEARSSELFMSSRSAAASLRIWCSTPVNQSNNQLNNQLISQTMNQSVN